MNKLPHDPLVRHHAWSDDPARDRRVRLAEDGVDRRKTLEEAIAGVFENKGESMDGIFHIDTEDTMRDEEHGEGMRTERVTLEIVHDANDSAAEWPWGLIISGEDRWGFFPDKGESVRVVPYAEIQPMKVMNVGEQWAEWCKLTAERDTLAARVAAADKEREEMRESALAHHNIAKAALDEKDKAEARVAELENENGNLGMAAEINCEEWEKAQTRVAELEATVKESLSVAAPAAEPVANSSAEPNGSAEPRGWLTPDEIAVCVGLRDQWEGIFKASGQSDQLAKGRFDTLSALLARNSPPEVVLPEIIKTHDAFRTMAQKDRDRQWIAALAAAGVEVESQS